MNAWDYNFWGSPVGLAFQASNTAAADGNGVFAFRDSAILGFQNSVFFTPTSMTSSNPALLNSSFDGVSGSNLLGIASYWLWSFQSGVGYADWIQLDDPGTPSELEAGYGFTMKGVNGLDTRDIFGDGVVNNNNDPNNIASHSPCTQSLDTSCSGKEACTHPYELVRYTNFSAFSKTFCSAKLHDIYSRAKIACWEVIYRLCA